MKKLCLVLVVLLVFPFTLADAGNTGKKQKAHSIVLRDNYGQIVGDLMGFRNDWLRIWMQIDHKDAILVVDKEEFSLSFPLGPMLFFENPGCDDEGAIYTRPELVDGSNWLTPRVVIAPGMAIFPDPPSFERFAYYAVTSEPGFYYPASVMSPEGYCEIFVPPPPPPEPQPVLWPVRKLKVCRGSDDLHWCYPPPYHLDAK